MARTMYNAMSVTATRGTYPQTRRRWQFWFFLLGIFAGIVHLRTPCMRCEPVLAGLPEFFMVPLGLFLLAIAVGMRTQQRLQMPAVVMAGIFLGDLLYLIALATLDDVPNLLPLTMLLSILAAAAVCYPGVLLGRLLRRR